MNSAVAAQIRREMTLSVTSLEKLASSGSVTADPTEVSLVSVLRARLREQADPSKALGMQAYMKSAMPYLGIQSPQLRQIYKAVFAQHPLATEQLWRSVVLTLWRQAAFREERYAAIELTGHRLYRAYQTPATLPVYEEMIVHGAWWDYVDAVAVHRLGPMLAAHPDAMREVMLGWSRSDHLWKRRSSIICQVTFKAATDLGLLYACIEPNLGDRDFFIRKAIGWALRQYAWTDPDEVARYVARHADELSALSLREALKNIQSQVRLTRQGARRRP